MGVALHWPLAFCFLFVDYWRCVSASTPYSSLFTLLRFLLGDRDPHGVFVYSSEDLTNAIDAVFLLGDSPEGYASLSGEITPAFAEPASLAVVVFCAALMLVGAEDGASSYRTRALSVTDSGQRRLYLINEFRNKLDEARNGGGGTVFITFQNFGVYLHNLCGEEPGSASPWGLLPGFIA